MQIRIRSKPFRTVVFLLAVLLFCSSILCVWMPQQVSAVKNLKIDKLHFCSPYGNWHLGKIQDVIDDVEESQHTFSYSLDDAHAKVSGLSDEDLEKQPIVIFAGEKWLDSKDTGTFSSYFDRSNLGSDTSGGLNAPNYNGVGFGRLLYGYDYTYQYTFKVYSKNGVDVYDEDYSANPNGSDTVNDAPNNDISGATPVYSEHHHEKDADGNEITDDHSNCVQKTETVTRTHHVEGVIEKWRKDRSGIKVYVFGAVPRSKEYLDAERKNGDELKAEMDEKENEAPQAFNSAFSKEAGDDFIDFFETLYQMQPYYSNGQDTGSSPKYYFDDAFYRTIFHVMWNTVLTLNPNDEPPEMVDIKLYSVASSLTTYMNTTISPMQGEVDDASLAHKLLPARTDYIGNAGAFLGYGDKDYSFYEYITTNNSKTSSTVDYSALVGIEGAKYSEMYQYARYGRLLTELGLDDTSTRVTFSPRLITGGVMFVVYGLSEGSSYLFNQVSKVLQWLNPFSWFTDIDNKVSYGDGGNADSHVNENSSQLGSSGGDTVDGEDITKNVEKAKSMPSNIGAMFGQLSTYLGKMYRTLQDMGITVIIPFLLVLFISGFLLTRVLMPAGGEKQWAQKQSSRFRMLLLRIVFIAVGIPLLGMTYTAVLANIGEIHEQQMGSGTQLVASTFVDFKGWAQKYRLAPLEGSFGKMTLESDGSDSVASGLASDDSYTNLRKNVAIINMATGAVDDEVAWGTSFASEDMVDDVLTGTSKSKSSETFQQGAGLISSYMFGDFYTAGAWESDTLTVLSDSVGDKMGRQQGMDEDEAPDNEDTVLEMFSETNTADAWNGRTPKDNLAIFENNKEGAYEGKWQDFNIFENGRLKVSNNKAKQNDSIVYTNNGSYYDTTSQAANGSNPKANMGLSTISMYNYLSTTFGEASMTMYSNEKAASEYTKQQHFATNLIGSGASRAVYYMNCFSVLFVAAIIAVYYVVAIIISNVKRSITLLFQIPFAAVGMVRSIIQVIMITCAMIAEFLATMLIYELIRDLMSVFVTIVEGPLADWVTDTLSSLTAQIGGVDVTIGSATVYFWNLGITALLLCLVGIGAKIMSKRFVYVYELVMEKIVYTFFLLDEVKATYQQLKTEQIPVKQPGFWLFREVILAS